MKFNSSLFAQILQVIPRSRFMRLVAESNAERASKGFSSWDQFVAMLFCQFAQSKSLREITDGLAVTMGKLNHLGMRKAPPKSTLGYANSHRPWELYRNAFFLLLDLARAESPGKKKKFRFKNKLLSLDATTIDLCLSLFPWAKFRQTKGAVKLHMLLDHDGYLPTFAVITDGLTHEIPVAHQLELPKGSIVAMDRGYCDYSLFHKWNSQGVFFVVRLRRSATTQVVEGKTPPKGSNVVKDEMVRFITSRAKRAYPGILRRITLWDEKNQQEVVLLTNHLTFGATTISQIYRDRWEIELFFKVLKQHLKIKTFVGTSQNALKTQIWTALITVLLIKYMQFKSKCTLPLCRLVALLRLNLFTYRDLWAWLADPFEVPPEHRPIQQALVF